eukprot:g607.t1
MLELLFEAYGVQKTLFVTDCLAAFHFNQSIGNCSPDGMLLASGHSATHVLPIVDGQALLFHAQRSKICGYQSTFHLQQLTLLHNPQCAGLLSKRNVELMKEQCCICSLNYMQDLQKIQNQEETAGGYGMRVQLPKPIAALSGSGNGNETVEIETPVEKTVKAEEQRNRLKAMSQKRKQKMIQEKQELLIYLKEIKIQVTETELTDIKQSILSDAEVDSEIELEKLITDTEASVERLLAPSPQKKSISMSKPVQEDSIETVRARYKELTEQLENKKRSRYSTSNSVESSTGNKRVSSEQRRRMKLVAEAAAIDEDDDDFGADDRDWDVYKEMDRNHSDSDFEKQAEAELQLTRNKLRNLGEDVDERDVFGKELGKDTQLDENQVYLSVERIRVPELIFQPCLMGMNQAGVSEIVSRVLNTLPHELTARCRKQILIYGGNTTFPGFHTRLASELCSWSPLGYPIRVISASDCFLDAWRGAALLAKNPMALEDAYSLQEYQELGPEAFKRKKLPFVNYPDGTGRESTVWGISGAKGHLLALLGTILLVLGAPSFVMFVYVVHTSFAGSIQELVAFVRSEGLTQATSLYQTADSDAWIIFGVFGMIQALFQLFLPGKTVHGPITPKGNTPVYKANGVQAYLFTLSLFFFGWKMDWFDPVFICDKFGKILSALNLFAFGLCIFLYFKGRLAPSSSDSGSTGNIVYDFYWGMELYPRIGKHFDIKTWTNCRVGMMSWSVLILCYAAKQHALYGFISDSMIISIILMQIYIFKFFLWESGYWASMDIAHDRAGYYLCWGCLNWVPGIYTSPALYLIRNPVQLGLPLSCLILLAGVCCVLVNYDADRQRQEFRRLNGKIKIWGKAPKMIKAQYKTKSGDKKTSLLLASGWWGLARHFHYVPEILGAFLWTLPGLFSNGLQYFYVVFLTLLLLDRAYRDDERCRSKYGTHWDTYCSIVPYKLIPGLF